MADVPDSKSGSSASSLIPYLWLASVPSRVIPERRKGRSGAGNGRVRPDHSIASPGPKAAADPAQVGADRLKPGSGGLVGSCQEVDQPGPQLDRRTCRTVGLMIDANGGKRGRGIQAGIRERAHDVRHVQNYWAHEEDAVPPHLAVDEARGRLQACLHELPDEWGRSRDR